MQWLFLSEGTNQLFSLILKLKQVKTSEKSSEKSDFRVKISIRVDLCPTTNEATAFSKLPYRT